MKRRLFTELKRRHVYRVAVAYAAVGWLVIQLASTVVPALHLSDALTTTIVVLVALGFPITLMLAWAFELTPEGVRRTEPADSLEASPSEQRRQVGRKLDFAIIAVLLVALGLMAWQRWAPHATAPAPTTARAQPTASPVDGKGAAAAAASASPATAIPAKSIAVLPFESLSEDKANAYFANGMQDLVLTKLSGIGDLKVISRTSTAKYASRPDDLKTIATQLGVAHVLEGSVQKSGNAVLINVQLIDARTDAHVWAQAYTRTLDNVFGVEGEVAEKIADALKAKLSPTETKRLATALSADGEANDLFLRAEYFLNRGNARGDNADVKQAIHLYRQALARAPDFALAHARLSRGESLLAFQGGGGEDVTQLDDSARAEAERAMHLAPDLAESHLAIGFCDYYGKSDYDAALEAFAAALALRPNDADALAARGYVLRRQGKFDEAVDALRRALAHDPRNAGLAENLGQAYMLTGRYDDAEQALRQALAMDPANDLARFNYARSIAFRSGDIDRAMREVQGDSVPMRQARVVGLTMQHDYRAALALLEKIPDTPDNFPIPKDVQVGDLYRHSGDIAQARAHYAKALPRLQALQPALANHLLAIASVWNAIAAAELGLGDTTAGIAAIEKSMAAGEKSGDFLAGPGIVEANAAAYAHAGRADKAVALLTRALATPGIGANYSPVLLWIDPAWDPIRRDPGFQALLEKYASHRPAKVPGDAETQ